MDKEYRIKKMTEAWEILIKEFSKDISERSEKNLNQVSYIIYNFAEKHELPPHPILEDDEYDFDDFIPFHINEFDPNAIVRYAEKMLSQTKKNKETRICNNVIEFRRTKSESNDDVSIPEIEKVKNKLKDFIEIEEVLSVPEIIEGISNGTAGKGDM